MFGMIPQPIVVGPETAHLLCLMAAIVGSQDHRADPEWCARRAFDILSAVVDEIRKIEAA